MVTKSSDTKTELASTGPEKERRPDATGALLEKQQAAAKSFQETKAAETPDAAETPNRKSTSVQSACRNFPEIRAWFLKSVLHREAGGGSAQYDLDAFQGPTGVLLEIIERHVKHRLSLSRDEQRFRELLKPHKQVPIPAPSEVVQRGMASPIDGSLQPRLKRATGPSEFAEVLATIVLLRSLQATTNRAAMLAVKGEVVRLEIALLNSIETFSPFQRPGIKPEDDPSTMLYDDSNGKLIGEARLQLSTATEVCRQRERMRDYYLALRKSNRWLTELLADVDRAVVAQSAEREKKDRAAQGRPAPSRPSGTDGSSY